MTPVARLAPCARGRCRYCQGADAVGSGYPAGHLYQVICVADGRRWTAAVYRDGRRLRAHGSGVSFSARRRERALRRADRYVGDQIAADVHRAAEQDADDLARRRFHALSQALEELVGALPAGRS